MILLFNILWFIIIGWVYSLIYLIGGAILYITVIFLPFGKTFFEIGKLCAFPIGKRIIKNDNIGNFENKYGIILNIIWLITFGIPLFIINGIIGLLIIPIYLINMVFMLIGIITFPLFLIMLGFFPVILALTSLILKLAKISLWPIGIKIVTDEGYYKNLIKKELKNYQPKDLNNDKNLNNNLDNKVTIKYNDPNVIELVDEEELNKKIIYNKKIKAEKINNFIYFGLFILDFLIILCFFSIFLNVGLILLSIILFFIIFSSYIVKILSFINLKYNFLEEKLEKLNKKIEKRLIFIYSIILFIFSINIIFIIYILISIIRFDINILDIIKIFFLINIFFIQNYIILYLQIKKFGGFKKVKIELNNLLVNLKSIGKK